VVLTARDNAQTAELSRERWPSIEVIGGHSPKARVAKAGNIARRVDDLRRWAKRIRPDVALSHNSYAQIVAARAARIPAVTAMDFEHQPANHLAFRLARTILLPEVLPAAAVRRQGATPQKTVRYPGLKEELYIGDFEPDPAILEKVGIQGRPRVVVLIRTPPSRAVYHHFDNPLFEDALRAACGLPGAVGVALARHPEQAAAIDRLGLPNCLVPRAAIDSRSLMYAADLMIGAGGTMTREAALMGIPTWTLFAGTTPAVDEWLVSQGSLKRLTDAAQVRSFKFEPSSKRTPAELRERAGRIERVIVDATLAAANPYPR
jgi:predicted glycosyltransferase